MPEEIPGEIYYSSKANNFYNMQKQGMGDEFFAKWLNRRSRFPQSHEQLLIKSYQKQIAESDAALGRLQEKCVELWEAWDNPDDKPEPLSYYFAGVYDEIKDTHIEGLVERMQELAENVDGSDEEEEEEDATS